MQTRIGISVVKQLGGYMVNDDFVHGFFDRDTICESSSTWANSIIVGRAKLGGVSMGFIAVDSETKETYRKPDPVSDCVLHFSSKKSGNVLYPDSSFKIAQAVKDFKNEKLPIIIFANWKGFSGIQSDMANEILKFGSLIVDELVWFNLF